MGKLIILQGPPCSGKSTWAREQVSGRHDWVIVSKDDIRHSFGDYLVPSREKLVEAVEEHAIDTALKMNYTVISDGPNLAERRIAALERLADANDAPVEKVELYVTYREAVRRDANAFRPRHMGEADIRAFYEQYFPARLAEELLQPEPEPEALVPRITTNEYGEQVWNPTPEDLATVKKMAGYRYRPSTIAHVLAVPSEVFMRHLNDPEGPVHKAYADGLVVGELAARQATIRAAEHGEEWAVKQMAAWEREQKIEELGG